MDRAKFEKFLDKEMVITDIVEDENNAYVFYTHSLYKHNGDENYRLIGVGPLLYDKKKGEIRELGSLEFYENHSHKQIFKERYGNTSQEEDEEEIKKNIREKKYVSSDDLEFIFDYLDIDYEDVLVYSKDFKNRIIEFNKNSDIANFEKFLTELFLKYSKKNNEIILKIGTNQ